MDEIQFQLGGQRHRLTRQEVLDRMARQEPEPVQTWGVVVGGQLFPVKQVLATTTGVDRNAFISHRARDLLRRLDFQVVDVTRQEGPGQAGGTPPFKMSLAAGSAPGTQAPERLAALEAAVRYVSPKPEASVEDVLNAATAFEAWLTR